MTKQQAEFTDLDGNNHTAVHTNAQQSNQGHTNAQEALGHYKPSPRTTLGVVDSTPGEGPRTSGCYVSRGKGLLLILVALGVASGVGVAVHYLSPDRGVANEMNGQGESGGLGDTGKATILPPVLVPYTPKRPKDVLLPKCLVPLHYNLELQPSFYDGLDPDQFSVTGLVEIYLNCTHPTKVIILHSMNLTIDDAQTSVEELTGVISMNSSEDEDTVIRVTSMEVDLDREFLKLHLDKDLKMGMGYRLRLAFSYLLGDKMTGLYRSSYVRDNRTRWLVTSHMEPTDARSVFPCFDEPALKSTFNVTLVRREGYTSLSNMPLVDTQTRADGWYADVFLKSVKMSTYLLAFIVSDFEFVLGYTMSGSEFRVFSRGDAIRQTQYALQTGIRMHNFFENYFNVTYPLPKQDLIAIPDFSSGAMENWGLITFRETALLYDPQLSSAINKQRIAVVISHELGHQWFGNLVSPAWWDDLWLNEGFASYVEYLGVNHVEPSWNMMDMFLIEDLHRVLALDTLSTSHPIYIPVHNPDEIGEIFDTITYSKGASIIRMMNAFLGEATFKAGLTRYLRRHQYANANHTDLWNALSEQSRLDGSNIDVGSVMNTWVKQLGYPLVTVSRESDNQLTVSQAHFLIDRNLSGMLPHSEFNYRWKVPFTYTFGLAPNWNRPASFWMSPDATSETLPVAVPASGSPNSSYDWILGNVGQFGYYRVNYDLDNWIRLLNQLKTNHSAIPLSNRAQIIDDSLHIGRAGVIDQLIGLRVTQYLTSETKYVPWYTATRHFSFFRKMLEKTATFGLYQDYVQKLVRSLYNRNVIGAPSSGDSHTNRLLKSLSMSLACDYSYQPCINDTLRRYREWMNMPSRNIIPTDIRSTVYCTAIQHGGRAEWDFAYRQYRSSNMAAEKDRLLHAMACSRVPWILSRYIHIAWSNISKQDTLNTLAYISIGPLGNQLVWNYIISNWPTVKQRFAGSLFSINRLITYMSESFNTELELQKLFDFKRRYPDLGSITRSYNQAVERTRLNIDWMNANQAKIDQWLRTVV